MASELLLLLPWALSLLPFPESAAVLFLHQKRSIVVSKCETRGHEFPIEWRNNCLMHQVQIRDTRRTMSNFFSNFTKSSFFQITLDRVDEVQLELEDSFCATNSLKSKMAMNFRLNGVAARHCHEANIGVVSLLHVHWYCTVILR